MKNAVENWRLAVVSEAIAWISSSDSRSASRT
jgi:hypothetical protein